jgi:hypothetical protein
MEYWSVGVMILPHQYFITPTLHHSIFFLASAPRIAEVRIATDDRPATTSHEL